MRELEESTQQEAKAVKVKVKNLEKTLLQQIEMIQRQNKEIYKLKASKPTPQAAPVEISTKVAEDNTVEIRTKCKECNFTGRTWNDLREHKWTACSEALIQRLLKEDAEHAGVDQEAAHQVAQEAPQVPQEETSQEEILQEQQELIQGQGEVGIQEDRREAAPTPAPRGVRVRGASSESREDPPEQRYNKNDYHQYNCDICNFQSNQESELNNHIDRKHMIKCYTCKLKFNNFSDMIKHRREKHPSQRICKNFPGCVWKD